jgi:glycosyltransferase involved in cell wall biosynthesis
MPSRYLLADIFVLPSRGAYETWGLAINEAMHLGLPCLVSDVVGCQRDLVIPGKTGWVFPADNLSALAATLSTALRTTPEEMQRFSQAATETMKGYTYQQTSAGLLEALASLPAD